MPIIVFISAPVITVVVVALVALKVTISDNEEFKKYFMQIIALILLWIGMLLSLYPCIFLIVHLLTRSLIARRY